MDGYGTEALQPMSAKIGEISLTQMLKDKQARLEQLLADVKRAQEILKENPTLAELHNLLVRIR